MKNLLIIILLFASSMSYSKDKTVKDMLTSTGGSFSEFIINDRIYIETLNGVSHYQIFKELSEKLQNKREYTVINKGSFILIKEGYRPAYFGNKGIIIKASHHTYNILIDKPLRGGFGCVEWNVPSLDMRDNLLELNPEGNNEYNYQPFIKLNDERFNKEQHSLYTIPYFNSNTDAVVIVLGESGNKGGVHGYLVFDTNTSDYEILDGIWECGDFPPSIVNRANEKTNIFFKIKKMLNLVN